MEEHWKPIPNHDGYFASDLGRIKSTIRKKERILSPYKKKGKSSTNAYMYVDIGKKHYRLHRLVLIAFTEDHPDLDVNHIDGNKLNNVLSNLEWCTRQENVNHSYDKNFNNLTPRKAIKDTTTEKVYYSIYEASKDLNIPHRSISEVLKGKHHSVKGHVFSYLQDL